MRPLAKRKYVKLLMFLMAFTGMLCSCITKNSSRPPLPLEVDMNEGAGNGGQLILTVRLETGDELPLGLDTGCFLTILDESLKNKLGPRFGKAVGGGQIGRPVEDMEIYIAPKLFLGKTPLVTSRQTLVKDTKNLSSRNRVLGILGMDCLRHYCVQLDFDTRKIRFLDPDNLDVQELGQAFPLIMKKRPLGGVSSYIDADLFEQKDLRFWVDTGFFGAFDFMLKPKLYQQVVKNHRPNRTGKSTSFLPFESDMANLPRAEFADELYADLKIEEMPDRLMDVPGWMSLQFLARHKVTFNFPKRVMYLKRRAPFSTPP